MDLLQCQKIRKLTIFYRQLKNLGTDLEAKIDRIEFISELHTVLVEEPHSVLLEEVQKLHNYIFGLHNLIIYGFVFSFLNCWDENKKCCWQTLIRRQYQHCDVDKTNCSEITSLRKRFSHHWTKLRNKSSKLIHRILSTFETNGMW